MFHHEYHAIPWAVASSKMMEIYTLLKSFPRPSTASQFQVIKKNYLKYYFLIQKLFLHPQTYTHTHIYNIFRFSH